ncbi:MAG: RidA family protein [Gemmatimonadaceae bacterium]
MAVTRLLTDHEVDEPIRFADGALAATGHVVDRVEVRADAHQAPVNLFQFVDAAGSTTESIVKVSLYLRNVDDLPIVNDAYARLLPTWQPARTAVSADLAFGAMIEIDAVAVCNP